MTPADYIIVNDYRFYPARFNAFDVPSLLLVGGNSPQELRRPTELLAAALPASRLVVMPGQGHAPITTAPDLLLREVLAFLTN